jgi:hypothetical protein
MKHSAALACLRGAFFLGLFSIFSTAVSAGTEPAGSMAVARYGHVSVGLADGRALVAGGPGTGFNPSTTSTEVFDPVTNTFSQTAPMAGGRMYASTARLPDGKVLVAGGMVTNSNPPDNRATAELYDPATGTWSATGSMSAGRQEAIAVPLPDGRVMVIAGDETARACEIYDPATGTFSPTGLLLQPRMRFVASVLPGGRVLVAGGEPAWSTPAHTSAEIWDPATGTWAATGSMAYGRYSATATPLADGKVLVVGGSTSESYSTVLAQAEVFDPVTGVFSPAGSLSVARSGHGAARLPSGDVVVVGGMTNIGLNSDSIERYNAATGAWVSGGTLAVARRFPAATALASGEVLVSGGLSAEAGPSAETIEAACIASLNTLSPGNASYPAAASSGSVSVSHAAGCAWRVSNVPSWITLTSPVPGFGNGVLTYSVAANTGSGRGATLKIGDASFYVSQADNACAGASLSPTSASFGLSGGNTSFTLNAASSCYWTVTGIPSWVSLPVTAGTGSRSISYSVAANSGAARTATLGLAGRTFTINQAANGCIPAPTISPASQSFAFGGGTNTVSISAPAGCPWSVVGKPTWITMSTSGSGSAALGVTAAANTGAARSATFTVAGNSFTATQAANVCASAAVTPSSVSLGSGAGPGGFNLTADPACTWTITGVPFWISITSGGTSGAGNATITYFYQDNTSFARSATLSVAGRTYTVSQDAGACASTSVSPVNSPLIPVAGGSGSVTVSTSPACTWSVSGLPAWVMVTSPLPVTGSGTLTYSVAPNAGSARNGGLLIAGAFGHTISQAGVAPPASYCPSRGNSSSYEWIQQVSIAGQLRSTGNNSGYADLTTSTAAIALSRTASNSIALTVGGPYTETWRIWIDFNGDSSFTDNEIVYTGSASGTISSSFAIPASAPGGTTRMRISMKYGGTPTSCEAFTWGEVEDYTVTY